MKYPSCCKGGTALLAALCLGACPVEAPSVTFDEPVAGQVASNGSKIQLAGSGGDEVSDAGAAGNGSGTSAGGAGNVSGTTVGGAGRSAGAAGGVSGTAGAGGSGNGAGASAGGVGGESGTSAGGAGDGAGSGGGDAGAAAGTSGTDGSGAGTVPAGVTFAVTTAAPGGKYQPKNIGAIWIETPASGFVKTLELWAKLRRRYLTKYNGAVGTSGTVDVTASATLSTHITHYVSWDHRDRSGATLEAGPFRLCLEITDADVTGPNYCFDFDTSAGMQTLTPADQRCFKSLTLTVE